jgi:hypothetical protein
MQKAFIFIRHFLFVLGLIPLSSLEAESRTTDEKFSESSSSAQIYLTGNYGTFGNSNTEIDLLFPVFQRFDKALLADIRFVKGEDNSQEWNMGLAYRWLTADRESLFGLYGFYDTQESALNNTFHQVTLGGEFKTVEWTLRGNYYIPTGTTTYNYHPTDGAELRPAQDGSGYQNLFISNTIERSLQGFNAEIGHNISAIPGLSLYGGYYHFDQTGLDEAVAGPRFRAEYQLASLGLSHSRWMQYVQLETAWQNDPVQGTLWNIGLKINIPFNKDATSALTDYIRRDTLTTILDQTEYTPYQNAAGKTLDFATITNEIDLNTALNSPNRPDVILIENDIFLTSNQSVSLGNNLMVTGGSFEYTPGYFFNVNETPSTLSIEGQDLLNVGKNVSLQNMGLTVIGLNNNAGPESAYYNAITNNNTSVGNLIINNVIVNGGIVNIAVADGSKDSNIVMENSIITLPGITTGVANPAYALSISAGDPTQTIAGTSVAATINNNAIIVTSPSISGLIEGMFGGGINLSVLTSGNAQLLNTMTVSSVSNNTVNFQADFSGGSMSGIIFSNENNQLLTGDISNNRVNIGNIDNAGFFGINIQNNNGTQTITGNIANNFVSTGDATIGAGIFGIQLDVKAGTQTVNGEIENNTITTGELTDNAVVYGLLMSITAGTQTIKGAITGNTITIAEITEAPAFGINVTNEQGQQIFGSDFSKNTVKIGNINNTQEENIVGIYFNNQTGTQTIAGNFSNNTITLGNVMVDDAPYAFGIQFNNNGIQSVNTGFYGNSMSSQSNAWNSYYNFSTNTTTTITIGNNATAGTEQVFADMNLNATKAATPNTYINITGNVVFKA